MNVFHKKTTTQLVCFLLLIICAAFSLSYPLAFRTANSLPLFFTSESYAVLATANQPLSSIFDAQSTFFSNSDSPNPFSFWQILYRIILNFLSPWALPTALSIIVILVLWIALGKLSKSVSLQFITACIFVFSPSFVSSQLTLSSQAFFFIAALTLVLLLYNHAKPIYCAISALIMGLFGVDAILIIAFSLIFTKSKKGYASIINQKIFSLIGGFIGLALWFTSMTLTKVPLSALVSITASETFFMEFGAVHGQTLLIFILASIGLILSWRQEYRWNITAAVCVVLGSKFFPMNGLLAAAILSYFASTVFVKIWNSKWDHSTLKYVALTCILVSVLTSYFVFTQIIINSQPASVDINAYRHLAKNTPANSVILSMPSQGGFIYYFTGRSPYISDIRQNSVYENRSKTFNEILASKSLDTTVALLRNSSINYIMINPRFASSNQWREDNGGLALMLRNRHAFTPTYQGDYLIYKVNDDFNISSNS